MIDRLKHELLQAYVSCDDLEKELSQVRSRIVELRGALVALQERDAQAAREQKPAANSEREGPEECSPSDESKTLTQT